jgi:site-specific recombinase XerC
MRRFNSRGSPGQDAFAFRTIRNYLSYASPVLRGWREHAASLREITRQDVQAAVSARTGEDAHHLIVALRSIFRALKQERLIFANPCAGISVTRSEALPVTLPPDRLAGLLDCAHTPAARLAVALTALHATQPAELRAVLMTDLDLPNARLAIRRRTGRHFVYLDKLTLACLDAWLRERHRRWPRTPNPHLLISQQTAADTTPVAPRYIDECFGPTETSPSRLRQDRILDEARHTADPVRLMRLFGISDTTAMKYVFTAHPERQSVPGR